MKRSSLVMTLFFSTAVFAGDVRFNVNFGNWRVGNTREPSRAVVPSYPVSAGYGYWMLYTPPAPPPPPQ